jgi:hypothetical protein
MKILSTCLKVLHTDRYDEGNTRILQFLVANVSKKEIKYVCARARACVCMCVCVCVCVYVCVCV